MSFAHSFEGPGAAFEELALDEKVGTEAVLLLVDTAPDELVARGNLKIELKAGIASTDYGPVLFLVWWLPPIIGGKPFALYEQLMNPLHSLTPVILGRLADQTHLHLVLLSTAGNVITVFEYVNSFNFNSIKAGLMTRGSRGRDTPTSIARSRHTKASTMFTA